MARTALELLSPGMRLTTPVRNASGVLLLKEGEVLTEKHLRILETWGIAEADVDCDGGGNPAANAQAALLREIMERVEKEMTHRFRRANLANDPVMAEIFQMGTRRVALQRAGRGEK